MDPSWVIAKFDSSQKTIAVNQNDQRISCTMWTMSIRAAWSAVVCSFQSTSANLINLMINLKQQPG